MAEIFNKHWSLEMKLKQMMNLSLGILGALSLTACANYRAMTLTNLSTDFIEKPFNLKEVSVGCKILNPTECKKYLGRNVIKAGYQPLQLTIRNNSLNNYLFSSSRIDLPCAKPDEVSEKLHTSTATRAGIYGTIGVLSCGLFLIPAVVDGMKSYDANQKIDRDYLRKSRDSLVLTPHAQLNTILFVPVEAYYDDFNITLINEETAEATKITVHARQ